VWLGSRTAWRARYQGWPPLKKLEYVDELMREVATARLEIRSRNRPDSVGELYKTLGTYYAERRALYRTAFPSTYDRDLKRIFPGGGDDPYRSTGDDGTREPSGSYFILSAARHPVARGSGSRPLV
jgi:hypothetical protein